MSAGIGNNSTFQVGTGGANSGFVYLSGVYTNVGSTILVFGAGGTGGAVNVSDGINTYKPSSNSPITDASDAANSYVWIANNCSALTNGVITISDASAVAPAASYLELINVTANSTDQANGLFSTSGAPYTCAVGTTQSNEIVVTYLVDNRGPDDNSITSSTFTILTHGALNGQELLVGYELAQTVGTYDPSFAGGGGSRVTQYTMSFFGSVSGFFPPMRLYSNGVSQIKNIVEYPIGSPGSIRLYANGTFICNSFAESSTPNPQRFYANGQFFSNTFNETG